MHSRVSAALIEGGRAMQIQNFYSDWLPASSGQLDNIVLSPLTLKQNDCSLSGMKSENSRLQDMATSDDADTLFCFVSKKTNDRDRDISPFIKCCKRMRNRLSRKTADQKSIGPVL
jgi:hypothetical protein